MNLFPEKLDQSNSDLNQLVQEKESMLKTIEALRADKNNLERNRLEINSMVYVRLSLELLGNFLVSVVYKLECNILESCFCYFTLTMTPLL